MGEFKAGIEVDMIVFIVYTHENLKNKKVLEWVPTQVFC